MAHDHTITLKGPALESAGTSGHLLRDVFGVLVQGAEQSLRFRLEGRSASRGSQPAWLRGAADFQMIELSSGRRVRTLKHQARSLRESMPERFEQTALFDDFDPSRIAGTARDLGADALHSQFGQHVVVTGTADFRPSGRLLRLNAEQVETATPNELQIFTSVPAPLQGPQVFEREPPKDGLAAIVGRWPGEESLETLLAQLKELG